MRSASLFVPDTTSDFAVGLLHRLRRDEREELLRQHHPHQFVAQPSIVVFRPFARRQFGHPHRKAQIKNLVVQRRDLALASFRAEPPVALHTTGFAVNLQQPVGELAILGVGRLQQASA